MYKILSVLLLLLFIIVGCTYFTGENQTDFYGVIIGIDEYSHPDIADLDYCVNDANGLLSALVGNGWEEDEITVLLNDQASKDTIVATLQSIVGAAQSDDYILVYYSGHGTSIEDLSGDEYDGYDEAIIPADAVLYNTATYLSDDELGEIFSKCKTEKGVFIFDSCNSGGLINKPLLVNRVKSRYIVHRAAAGSGTNGDLDIINFPVLTASGNDEDSWEDSYLQHGVFTYFLLDGLEELRADDNDDDYVTVRELFEYAAASTEAYIEVQHPQLRYPWEFFDILVTR